MARIVKTAEERTLEIIQVAQKLFMEKGYSNTSIQAIINEVGVAKGTFYYYFNSKEDVLEAIVNYTLDDLLKQAQQVADNETLDAVSKIQLILSNINVSDDDSNVVDYLHQPNNRELHEMANVQVVLRLSPILAEIVEQGNKEKVFKVKRPLETVQLLLCGSQFLLDGGLFAFSKQEIMARQLVIQEIIEKALAAKTGTFSFMANPKGVGDE
ncbi:MAG TPA: TetR/AcrR family transcriptional regulator [Trueperaceae bacterium]|nr:TetR/AcrR family transcriptional regulator [Trueperaceae bacterium]